MKGVVMKPNIAQIKNYKNSEYPPSFPFLLSLLMSGLLSHDTPAVNEISAEKMHSVHQGILRAVSTETSVVVAEYIIHSVWWKLGY